ncbi:putative Ring finger protein [Quillaja saponaria]|uniref:RING-type E3 ubiquitin transferase n=1 Tax=Quillaja saponaria TaxID=32244 RepID=A0AAD7PS60_QUISA|nr:putative Ring finger protein [Quillaja saponaria]
MLESEADDPNGGHPTKGIVIVVLCVMFSITFLLIAYAKFCRNNPVELLNQNQNFQGLIRSRSRFSGIDKAVLESLPIFRFSLLKGSKEGLECAICITKFENNDILRLLPKCKHAFHKNCIDQWLESHSSCPLCRYKIDPKDLKNLTYSNSLRFLRSPSDLTEDSNLEITVQREKDNRGSSRFNIGSSFRKNDRGKKGELLINQEGTSIKSNWKLLDKFNHKIIISDVVLKNRWSDFDSSDLLSLSSEMLSIMSSNRFSSLESINNEKLHDGLTMEEHMAKVKEDIDRKRSFEFKLSNINSNICHSASSSTLPSTSNVEENSTRLLKPAEKRSMSEIKNVSRFIEIKNSLKESAAYGGNDSKEERLKSIWFPIARQTVQWVAGRERSLQEQQYNHSASNV